jgi:ribonuclease HI
MIYIYTDGACSGNPGPGGSSFIAVEDNKEIYHWSMPIPEATNNMCELLAIVEACRWAKEVYPLEKITIRTDSAYCHNCWAQKWYENWLRNGWKNSKKEPVANKTLWLQLIPFFKDENFTFEKVKGHTGKNDWNDMVDKLAVIARNTLV